jgi:glycosyltransferase involved in cell wall biosynthesis
MTGEGRFVPETGGRPPAAGDTASRDAAVPTRMRARATVITRRAARPVHRMLRLAVLAVVRSLLAMRRPPRRGERLRVRVLLQHAHGTGGTIRTVLNLGGHLAAEHDVEVVSVFRRRAEPFFPVSPSLRIRFVDDRTGPPAGRIARLLSRLPSVITPVDDASFRSMTLWSDLLLLRLLCGRQPDVLIGTRPSLNLLAAELSPRGVVTIGQDHMNLAAYRPGLRREIERAYRRLTAVSVLTERSRADYEAALAGAPTRVVRIPNALPGLPGGPSPRERRVILAAGRLTRQKGFDLLVRAYEPLAAEHPDWTLRIFGSGVGRDRLRRMIDERGLADRVLLRARTPDLAGEMERASAYVLSSRFEGMPMVIIEAMSKGLPVVAFDCPTGPGEMIEDGGNGLLVPAGDVAGLTAALRAVIRDRALRERLGERALASSAAYHLDRVGPQWSRLLRDLCPAPGAEPEPGTVPPPGPAPARRRRTVAVVALIGLALGALGLLGSDV